ncbi:intradiol ring-cleavage dioxygenase [Diaphorobacter sp. HDW4A]|uniref:intradiol ring-cleavage dioxygenase n=1 Tax=Diaphorobacter sp. HDW4A TaxID=2714924 RepID=UPI00140A7B1F|nr:intradiol ring-cleavage dioxygenase [Diaphorobacter sp. HDW4A]QIL78550.1 intradiol ring-cleavage dioxygenase [Diaphorobacter sp. HDW4A]
MYENDKATNTHAADQHDHDGGLQQDLIVDALRDPRRRMLLGGLIASGTVALIGGCGGGTDSTTDSSSSTTTTTGTTTGTSTDTTTTTNTDTSTTTSSCIADPQETEGPYPGDGSNSSNGAVANVLALSGVVRSDIRSSFGSATGTAQGVPLTLTISVVNSNASCAALEGYAIYIWHCTRDGTYTLYSNDVLKENYLRGVQVTDSKGQVTFETIFPACYSGRWPHIHFEIYPSLAKATSYKNKILTSQMALPKDICTTVFNNATGYSASVRNLSQVTIASDNVFGDNTAAQIAQQTPTLEGSVAKGYTGTIVIGVPV